MTSWFPNCSSKQVLPLRKVSRKHISRQQRICLYAYMPICAYGHIGMNGFPEVPFLGHISRSKAQTEQLIGEWHRRDRGSSRRPRHKPAGGPTASAATPTTSSKKQA